MNATPDKHLIRFPFPVWLLGSFSVYACLAFLTVCLTITFMPLDIEAYKLAYGDAIKYLKLSQEPFSQVPYPFSHRILSPSIAYFLTTRMGMRLDHAWALISALGTWLCLVFFFRIMKDYALTSTRIAFLTTVLLATSSWYSLFNLGNIYLVDPLHNLAICAGLYFSLRQAWVFWFLAILIGFTNKETALFAAPLFPLIAFVRSGRLFDRNVLLGVVGLVVLVGLYYGYRTAVSQIIISNGQVVNPLAGEFGMSVEENMRFCLSSQRKMTDVFNVFHFVWMLCAFFPFVSYRRSADKIYLSEVTILLGYFLALVCIVRIFTTDTPRILSIMAPVVLLAAGLLFQRAFSGKSAPLMLAVVLPYVLLNTIPGLGPEISLILNTGSLVVFAIGWQSQEGNRLPEPQG